MANTTGEFSQLPADELSAEHYELILRNIHDAVYALDAEGQIIWVNDIAFDEFNTGYSRDELIGAHVSKLLSEEDIDKCTTIISNLLHEEEQESGRCEISLQTANGGEIPCELNLTLSPSQDGTFQGTIGVLRDITERKFREQGRMVLNRVLRHDLRNDLNVILSHAELLEFGVDKKLARHVDGIMEAVDNLSQLSKKGRHVDDVLAEEDQALEPVDVSGVVEECLQEFRKRFPDIEIRLKAPASIWILADHRKEVLIENLFETSIKQTDPQATEIDVTITEDDEWVKIRVSDNGQPIPPAEMKAVTNGVETPVEHGTGLRLWLVKWLVERYGGELVIEERHPRGNLITIRLRKATPPMGI